MSKLRPILFSTPMVDAILAGRKTQTRRVNGLEVINVNPNDWQFEWADYALRKPWRFTQKSSLNEQKLSDNSFNQEAISCPYGNLGDVLWVRETWCLCTPYGPEDYYYGYKVDSGVRIKASDKYDYQSPDIWKPSIHMPKDAARIFLEITNIRVERLQDISEEDAIKEGIQFNPDAPAAVSNKGAFAKLWESINGKESWKANPWVWVFEFKQIEKQV